MDSTIWVVGSLNADLVQRVRRLPVPGETLMGADLRTIPGGKGANQAYAAARLGGRVRMIGNVGVDDFGGMLTASLREAGAEVERVARVPGATGTATILVLESGENAIIVSPGANGTLTPEDARTRLDGIGADDYLLCQLESPMETVLAALQTAKARGATTLLDPAPAKALPAELLAVVDILTPNESETQALLGDASVDEQDCTGAATALRQLGPSTVILKRGAAGAYVDDGDESVVIEAAAVSVVDTTGAGDVFNGAMAARLSAGDALAEAAAYAVRAATLSVTRAGAQPSMPGADEVAGFPAGG